MLRPLPSALAAFALLALAGLASCAAPEARVAKTDYFDGGVTVAIENPAQTSLRQQVEANWNIPGGNPCHDLIVLRATVTPSGMVDRIDQIGRIPPGKACHEVAETAVRALRVSSPLNFPPDNQPPSVDFSFRLPAWVD